MKSSPIADLVLERDEWGRQLANLAERWVRARQAGVATNEIDRAMAQADRQLRRLNRRIRRRRR